MLGAFVRRAAPQWAVCGMPAHKDAITSMYVISRRFSSCAHGNYQKVLESSLITILSLVKPVEEDKIKRLKSLDEFTCHLHSMEGFRGAVVKPFGSFVSNLYSKTSDLDLCVNLSCNPNEPVQRTNKLFLLLDILKLLQNSGIGKNFKLLPLARVPLLIYESKQHNINCDVTIDNDIAVIKTNLIHLISQMDCRFRDLVLLIKEWAKAHNINDAKQRTLNSLSIYLLVMFHFQTCDPPILPPLRDIYEGDVVGDIRGKSYSERYIRDIFISNMAKFKSSNTSSLSELFLSFFEKFSNIGSMSSQYVICTYTGRWENILSKPQWLETSPFDKLLIEDPFRQPENAACSVGSRELIRISNAFAETHERLASFCEQSDRASLVEFFVRPDIISHADVCTPGRTSTVC